MAEWPDVIISRFADRASVFSTVYHASNEA